MDAALAAGADRPSSGMTRPLQPEAIRGDRGRAPSTASKPIGSSGSALADTIGLHHRTGSRHVTALQMTRSDSRGIPARPRAARRMNGVWTESLLNDWEHLVKRAESGAAAHLTGCPQCDGEDGLTARDELEALIGRGRRRGQRLSQRVQVLDERFMAATTPSPFTPRGAGWWHHRNLD